ncbi:MAG: hypothetical protein LC779_05980, partial [Actinobacteria bacterium]|nr:hypothetical protein [Actinomycetota bacterium]
RAAVGPMRAALLDQAGERELLVTVEGTVVGSLAPRLSALLRPAVQHAAATGQPLEYPAQFDGDSLRLDIA